MLHRLLRLRPLSDMLRSLSRPSPRWLGERIETPKIHHVLHPVAVIPPKKQIVFFLVVVMSPFLLEEISVPD